MTGRPIKVITIEALRVGDAGWAGGAAYFSVIGPSVVRPTSLPSAAR
jgi:hypothetical protein